MTQVRPFTLKFSDDALEDLRSRLLHTRWPGPMPQPGWAYGADLDYMKQLIDYWAHSFDWPAQERHLNSFPQFTAEVDGQLIHFVHVRGKGQNPLPLVMSHGWPSSFVELLKIVPLLTDPKAHGGDASDSFDVVVPSLPGYAFSGRPSQPGNSTNPHTADLWAKLMTEVLGYKRFGAQGTDIGSGITMFLGILHPDSVVGVHLPGVLAAPPTDRPLTAQEQAVQAKRDQFMRIGSGYAIQQATYPQTLAYGLEDSPAGLAAWIVDKHREWSDCDGEVERRFSKDELLTNISIYWLTRTINSSFLFYYDRQHAQPPPAGPIHVPVGVAAWPKEIYSYVREWAERENNITRWTDMDRGGHFPAAEEPELLAGEIRAFFKPLR
jgi:microsomal epoxide hydrolase